MRFKYINKILISIILLIGIFFLYICKKDNSNNIININNGIIRNNLTALLDFNESKKIRFNELTQFEWEKVYIFDPYISKEKIFESIGFKWSGIKEQTTESGMQIVFVNNNNVVCYCCGTGEKNGYFINGEISHEKMMFRKNEEIVFWYDCELSEKLGYVYIKRETEMTQGDEIQGDDSVVLISDS